MRQIGLAFLFILTVSFSIQAGPVLNLEGLTERLSNKHVASELNANAGKLSNLKFNQNQAVGHVGWVKQNGITVGTAGTPVFELMSSPEVCSVPAPVLGTPEPASMLLLGTGLLGIGAMVRKAHHRRIKN